MKKFLLTLSILTVFAGPVWAAECTDGILVTAQEVLANPKCKGPNCPKKTYCKSERIMDWASAKDWCAKQNRKLVSLQDVCPKAPEKANKVAGACPNMQGSGAGWIWTSAAPDEKFPLAVKLENGMVNDRKPAHLRRYALCD